jgi:hypothetical protein
MTNDAPRFALMTADRKADLMRAGKTHWKGDDWQEVVERFNRSRAPYVCIFDFSLFSGGIRCEKGQGANV